MIDWIRANVIPTLIVIAIVVTLALVGWQQWQRSLGATTESNLAKAQTGASIAIGADAIDTLGNRMAAGAARGQLTKEKENDNAIRSADGASAPVAAPVRDAGRASLCQRAANRGKPECVQYAHP